MRLLRTSALLANPTSPIAEILNLAKLRVFTIVVEHGGASRAAALLFRAQSAVTRSVRELQETLGERLLERRPSSMLPTSVVGWLLGIDRVLAIATATTNVIGNARAVKMGGHVRPAETRRLRERPSRAVSRTGDSLGVRTSALRSRHTSRRSFTSYFHFPPSLAENQHGSESHSAYWPHCNYRLRRSGAYFRSRIDRGRP
ncbi:LysR family transcriptional regulator [Paraburkholderia fungorum]|uniref:helix-turn-helix domain-containing protein n=1 Tax=Paraburkholderia fungorum TaxID=134537 RepID=UPI003C6E99CB